MTKDSSTALKILGLTILIVIISSSLLSPGSTDIHLHDTYFIMDAVTKLVLLTLLALFAIGLLASIWTGFKNRLYVRILLFSTFLLISFGMYIFFTLITVK
jgi:hypothetical protein